MEAMGICSMSSSAAPFLIKSMATKKPSTKLAGTNKGSAVGINRATQPVKLLSNVEKLKLLTKAEKAGLLSAAEKSGLSLSTIERLGLLSKAEELGVLSAATDPGTPQALLSLSLVLLALGPACVYVVSEDNAVEVALQIMVALVSILGGSAAFAASNFITKLQGST